MAKRGVLDIPQFIELKTLIEELTSTKAWPYKTEMEKKQVRDKALLAFLAETGVRISEALSVNYGQVELNTDKDFIIVRRVKILKRRKSPITKDFPLPKRGILKPLTQMFLTWFNWPKRHKKKDDRIFTISRNRAWQIINHMTGKWCHYFRSQRISYMINQKRIPTAAVARILGVKKVDTIGHYAIADWKDFREEMK